MSADRPAPRLAATVLLVRDGADIGPRADVPRGGLEVFMVERHHQIDFATGALVFPGGKVDASDADPRLRACCAGADAFDDAALALRIAAIRETFEECGVMLAHGLVRAPAADPDFAALVLREKLALACDALLPFAHWITPEVVPKRFDTHFFLAAAPADQLALHDGSESVDSVWIAPAAALDEAEAGRRTIIFPTLLNLAKLAQARDVADAFARARARPVVTVQPALVVAASGKRELRIPAEAGYPSLPPGLAKYGAV